MRTISPLGRALIATVVFAVAGCGGDDRPDGGAGEKPSTSARPPAPEIRAVCKAAARDLADPRAVERKLPESPVPTVTEDRKLKRRAAALRGTKSVMQRVYDAAREKPHARYRRSLRSLIQELDDAELIARQEYDVAEVGPRLRKRWKRAQRAAASAGLEPCARLRQPDA